MRPPTIGWAGVRDAGAGCVGAGSPETLYTAATQAGPDFLAAADYDTITQCRYVHAASSPDLVFVRGMEVTTATGKGVGASGLKWVQWYGGTGVVSDRCNYRPPGHDLTPVHRWSRGSSA